MLYSATLVGVDAMEMENNSGPGEMRTLQEP